MKLSNAASKSTYRSAHEANELFRREQPASQRPRPSPPGSYPAQFPPQPRMNAVAAAPLPKIEDRSPAIAWFPVAVFALVWLEVVSRLRFEWSVNPQYGYGWAVPILAAYIFYRRWQNAPPAGGAASERLLGCADCHRGAGSYPRPAHSGSESGLAIVELGDGA